MEEKKEKLLSLRNEFATLARRFVVLIHLVDMTPQKYTEEYWDCHNKMVDIYNEMRPLIVEVEGNEKVRFRDEFEDATGVSLFLMDIRGDEDR